MSLLRTHSIAVRRPSPHGAIRVVPRAGRLKVGMHVIRAAGLYVQAGYVATGYVADYAQSINQDEMRVRVISQKPVVRIR